MNQVTIDKRITIIQKIFSIETFHGTPMKASHQLENAVLKKIWISQLNCLKLFEYYNWIVQILLPNINGELPNSLNGELLTNSLIVTIRLCTSLVQIMCLLLSTHKNPSIPNNSNKKKKLSKF